LKPLRSPSSTATISQVCREFGTTPRALRYYEEMGLLSPIRREQKRVYSDKDRARLRRILGGRRAGFSLRAIRELLDIRDKEDKTSVQAKALPRFKAQLSVLENRRRQLDEAIETLRAASARLAQAGPQGRADKQSVQRQA